MIGHNRIGASAYTSQPAIVQSATRNCAWYKNEIKRLGTVVSHTAGEYRKTVKEFKEGGTWKEEYKTWAAVCEHVLQISRGRADQLIRELTEYYEENNGSPLPETPNEENKKEEAALKQVEKAREPKPAEPEADKEDDEKPAVHSADEKSNDKPEVNGHTKPKENGKPKYQLALWGELETYSGKALNRADELNRQCPCPVKHALYIQQTKAAMDTLKSWREMIQTR